jgi:aspartate aminotransferase
VITSLSERVQRIKPSPTLMVTARANQLRAAGKDIIGLGAGEPDFDTPDFIKKAAIEAIKDGFTKYTPVDGTDSLKKAVISKFQRENGLIYEKEQILVSCGCKQVFYNLTQALLCRGDEVIIPAPYWVSYPDIVLLAEGNPIIVRAGIEQNFKITPEQLEAAITPRTKLLILNSPSNPTGVTYKSKELKALGDILRWHPQIYVATDDIYEHIQWTGERFQNILNVCPYLYDRTIVLNGVSKAYSMTGWRIGYCGGPYELIKAMTNIQSQSTSNPTSISQVAAEAGLNGDQSCIKSMCETFKERHDYVYNTLRKIPGVTVTPSDGTFYIFPSFEKVIGYLGLHNDIDFAELLLNKVGVAVVPGSAFGADGYTRISFSTSMSNLEEAMKRIIQFVVS